MFHSKTKLTKLSLGGRIFPVEQVHESPNVYVIENFLKKSEVQYIVSRTVNQGGSKTKRTLFRPSYTDGADGRQKNITEYRTSEFCHMRKADNQVVRAIEQRAADLIGTTPDRVEPFQIVRYREGQKFDLHHDAGTLNIKTKQVESLPSGAVRIATIFIYLNTTKEGVGLTQFPYLKTTENHTLSVQPTEGRAVVFCNILPSGEADPLTSHKACPVSGNNTKIGMNVWVCDRSQHV